MRKGGRSESGRKKVEQPTLEQRIEAFNQDTYRAIEAHSGDNIPKTANAIRQAHTELDKILALHTTETASLSSEDHLKFNEGTNHAREQLRELFTQININQRALRENPSPSTVAQPPANKQGLTAASSPRSEGRPLPAIPRTLKTVVRSERVQSEKIEKAEQTKNAQEAFRQFNQILNKADKLASAGATPKDLRSLNADVKAFQQTPAYHALKPADKENIEKEIASKVQKISEERLKQASSPTTMTKAAPARPTDSEAGTKLSMALSFKYDDLLMRATHLHHHGAGKYDDMKKLRADYKAFTDQANFQALKGSIKNGFVSAMEKLLPPIPEDKQSPTIGTRRQQPPLPGDAAALLEQAQKLVSEPATPKEIVRVLNDYHQFTQTTDFKNAAQKAKDQFVESFENAIRELSNPKQEVSASQKQTTKPETNAESRASSSSDPALKAKSQPPKKPPPVFEKVMQERSEKLKSQSNESITTTRQSRSSSIKGA